MTRKECLEQAMGCVLHDRNNAYGGPEDSFGVIARMWGAYLGVCVSAHDVAAMMALLKIARFRHNPFHEDNAVDCAGYAACMVETATAWEREGEDEAEGVCFQNGNSSPEFNPGDRVQYRVELPSVSDRIWIDAKYVRHLPDGRGHIVQDKEGGSILVGDKDIRPAPRAEGCEALVEKDAPQTKEELFNRILSVNPATFHTPSYAEEQLEHRSRLQAHKPTGEELAEMAEEDAHG